MIKNNILRSLTLLSFILFILVSCERRGGKSTTTKEPKTQTTDSTNIPTIKNDKISKVTFYIENSGSMYGYLRGATAYIDVLTELAQKPQFVKEKTPRIFNFINGAGDKLAITPIGNEPSILTSKLNKKGYNCGDPSTSDLNTMFQIALEKATRDNVSILISDGIYDVNSSDPLTAIINLGKETRSRFIERLQEDDIQTIMIKLISDFNGRYHFISRNGSKHIRQKRPFYIWIFGKSSHLNKYFSEDYITKLNGYDSMIRFLKMDESEVPYQITTYKRKGFFKFNKANKNLIEDAKVDRRNRDFEFSVAVDFSSLPFSDSYLNSPSNYTISGDYEIKSIENINEVDEKIYGLKINATHILTVYTNKNPFGVLFISLKNTVPDWINSTNIDDDSDIRSNTSQTIGFKHLTNGITDAYQEFSKEEGAITTFKIEIKK